MKPAEVKKEDNEFDLYRKRMMLAYRFRPNPLVCGLCVCGVCECVVCECVVCVCVCGVCVCV